MPVDGVAFERTASDRGLRFSEVRTKRRCACATSNLRYDRVARDEVAQQATAAAPASAATVGASATATREGI